jgi:hypothetical protein
MQAKDNRQLQEQIELEELSWEQREELFKEFASSQQKEELELLSQRQREEFERNVSSREQEQLEEYRLKKLKQEYERERGEPIELFLDRMNSKSNPQSPSLTQDYLKFKQTSQQQEEREHKQYYQDNPNYSSLDNFKVWFYVKRADDEFQIRHGIYPPQESTPAGIVFEARVIQDAKLTRLIREEKERLKLDGFSAIQIELQKDKILQKAHEKLDKEWKETIAKNLKEEKGIKSVESFVSSNEENSSQAKEVKVSDLEEWRQEAQELNRSERHLDKIDRVIESSTEQANKNNPNATVKISDRDFKAMQRDRSEFKQTQELEQRQEHSQNQSVARGRGR